MPVEKKHIHSILYTCLLLPRSILIKQTYRHAYFHQNIGCTQQTHFLFGIFKHFWTCEASIILKQRLWSPSMVGRLEDHNATVCEMSRRLVPQTREGQQSQHRGGHAGHRQPWAQEKGLARGCVLGPQLGTVKKGSFLADKIWVVTRFNR